MKISKLADKEVNGLFRRQGKRGDTWIYARFKEGKMERGSLGSCDVFTVEEARRWAHLKNISAAGKVPEFTLGEVVDKLTKVAKRKGTNADKRRALVQPSPLSKRFNADR